MNRAAKTLELDKVLLMLAEETSCEGSRELALAQTPVTDYDDAIANLTKTNDAYDLSVRFGSPTILKIKDVSGAARRSQAEAVLSLRELLNIAEVLRTTRSLCEWKKQCESVETSLDSLFFKLTPNKRLEDLIITSILSEDEVADNASVELASIRRKIKQTGLKIKDQLDKMIRSQTVSKYLQDAIVTIRDGRYVIPVKNEYKSEIAGLVHDTSASGATIFIEPMTVVDANNDIKVLQAKEKDEIERIVANLSYEVSLCADIIIESYNAILDIDLCFSKARLAFKMKASCPNVVDSGIINLRKARHPLINQKNVVPIDVSLGESYNTLVITGPNTGGKTVTLKTLGLLTLMTMCGLMIPVGDNSTISLFKNVLVDIGDEQSIEQSLSTFSAHITNIINILSRADSDSLVLLDELGAGTDPTEGAALAISLIEKLAEKGCKVAATTHYSEVKIYALTTGGVENASCEFDVKTLRPTYRLLIGVPGKSNAFEISKRLGLCDDVIERARGYVSAESSKFEDVVSKLEETRQELEKERDQAERLTREALEIKKQIENERSWLENEKEKLIEQAREKAMSIVRDVKLESDKLINELEEIKNKKDSEEFSKLSLDAKKKLRAKIDNLAEVADPITRRSDNANYKLPRKLIPGDNVLVVDINKHGNVIETADKSGMVLVMVGIIKMRTPLSNLRLADEGFKKQNDSKSSRRTGDIKLSSAFKNEIDIRGKNVEEALLELDLFIDDAVMSNVENITIIHGKGTGVLRSAVLQHLKKHRNIKTFRLGVYGEGENGVTIATIK